MPLPDFILAGAPKAGTSSLWNYIRQHPDVFMPEDKELFFFDFKYDRGVEWYKQCFDGHADESAIGEATVWYMRWQPVPERMHAVLPDVKLIFVLRNPIDRARSNFWHDFRDGQYPFSMSFSDFIRSPIRNNRTIMSSGYYHQHLKRFEQYFDRDQFLILLFEDVRQQPQNTLEQVYSFLDVDPSFTPNLERKLNVSWGFRYLDALRTVNRALPTLDALDGNTPLTWLWREYRHFRQIFWAKGTRPPSMSSEDRAYLQDHYADHNTRLSEYLDRDLSHWT